MEMVAKWLFPHAAPTPAESHFNSRLYKCFCLGAETETIYIC